MPIFYPEISPKAYAISRPQDIMKKEDGAYVKYALGALLEHRYQVIL